MIEALKQRIKTLFSRLVINEDLDRDQAKALRDHEGRISGLERKVEQRVKTLDAEE